MAKAKAETVIISGVKALVPVNYSGTLYGPGLPEGDTFDCDEQCIKQLVDVGAVEVPAPIVAADQ